MEQIAGYVSDDDKQGLADRAASIDVAPRVTAPLAGAGNGHAVAGHGAVGAHPPVDAPVMYLVDMGGHMAIPMYVRAHLVILVLDECFSRSWFNRHVGEVLNTRWLPAGKEVWGDVARHVPVNVPGTGGRITDVRHRLFS